MLLNSKLKKEKGERTPRIEYMLHRNLVVAVLT